ncbi:MAG: 50S ribosomal protein L3 [SAR324 cluster bacterium]|nr:50S ribosomal protein L3 [SAR324 cluster bacterium]
MLNGIMGRKIGMTQIFEADGTAVPVTVVQVGPVTVVQKKTEEQEGYNSVQVGYEEIPDRKTNKPMKGHLKSQKAVRILKEFKVDDIAQVELGQVFDYSMFEEGETIAITGVSKGKGFSGTIKRHNFGGQPASHGHRGHRRTGSIGQCATPARVFKGKKMPGQYGNKNVTVLGLKVSKIIPEQNLLLIRGAVPGKNGGVVTLKKSGR